jgi:patatin-like phospholipase/acyl hydrolase
MKDKDFNILVLDGGGSKGVYTIGVLKELELKLNCPLHEHFQLIYGTSTGSIIASLIALGHSIDEIEKLYFELIPKIMISGSNQKRSKQLQIQADTVFKDKKFDKFKTNIGIVALNYNNQKPLIFKSKIEQAHGMKQSFDAGFGCTISDAVQCSCSAYPVFAIKKIDTTNQGQINVVDGGFIANNATLFALIDANKAFQVQEKNINLLSVGVGKFIETPMKLGLKAKIVSKFKFAKFIERILMANTNTNVVLSNLLYPELNMVRINDAFNKPEHGTNMLENDEAKLKTLIQLGRASFANFEKEIDNLFNIKK